jgi:hypothetical protein
MDGTVTYTPDAEYAGDDSFTYTVDDDEGATSNEATVTVDIETPPEYVLYLPLVGRGLQAANGSMSYLPLVIRAR